MRLDITAVLTGERDRLDVDFSFPADSVPDFSAFADYDIAFTSDISVHGTVSGGAGYTVFRCRVSGEYVSHCARCCEDIAGVLEVDIERCVAEELSGEDNGDFIIADNGCIDTDEVICDEFLLCAPSKLLCRDDCAGLCPKCGKNLNEGKCSCRGDIDPRLSKLAELLDSDNNE